MLRDYETTIVVDAHLPGEQVDATITKYTKLIEDQKGKVKFIDRWGKRRLAYEIAKKQYGYYVYIRFEADGSFIKELEREYKLDDSIIRYLTVLIPKVVLKKEQSDKSEPKETKKEDKPTPAEQPADVSSSEEKPSADKTEPQNDETNSAEGK
jgi:small subunit ribosomal protein S6